MPLTNDSIGLGRIIRLLKHLECQNLSIILDSLGTPNGSEKWKKKKVSWRSRRRSSWNLIHIEEDIVGKTLKAPTCKSSLPLVGPLGPSVSLQPPRAIHSLVIYN